MVINTRAGRWGNEKSRVKTRTCTKGDALPTSQREGGWSSYNGKMMKFTSWSSLPNSRLLSAFLHDVFPKRWHTTGKWKTGSRVGSVWLQRWENIGDGVGRTKLKVIF